MAEHDPSRRMRLVAMGAALLALVFTLVAVIVVLRRGSGHDATSARQTTAQVTDHDVHASDVVKLRHDALEPVIEKGTPKGMRLKDPALAQVLGLDADDVITSISGMPMLRELDAYEAVFRLATFRPTIIYVELARKDTPMLLRWRLDGDLRQARYGAAGTGVGSLGSLGALGSSGSLGSPGATNPLNPYAATPLASDPDPVLDTIEKVDDWHYKLPRKTVDAVLADVDKYARSARIVPAIRNGQPDGFKLYAIRPSSVYARIGLANGDTIHTINGADMSSPDKALEVYTKLKTFDQVAIELTRRGQPMLLTIQITK